MTVCSRCGKDKGKALVREMCASCYTTVRKRQIAYGTWSPSIAPVDRARAHALALLAAGLTLPQMQRLSGIHKGNLKRLAGGSSDTMRLSTLDGILAVPIPATAAELISLATDSDLVSPLGASRRLKSLVRAGWSITDLARELGVERFVTSRIVNRRRMIRAATHHEICALFDRLQFETGPSDDARAYGKAKRWPLPWQWDEEALDERDGRPVPNSRRYPARRAS